MENRLQPSKVQTLLGDPQKQFHDLFSWWLKSKQQIEWQTKFTQ